MSICGIFRCLKTSPEIIPLAVMMDVRYPLSLRNVESLLREREIAIMYAAVRFRWSWFGAIFGCAPNRK
jgi:transposase-like protein